MQSHYDLVNGINSLSVTGTIAQSYASDSASPSPTVRGAAALAWPLAPNRKLAHRDWQRFPGRVSLRVT
eukprot:3498899-Rhodomonas_salina.1